MKTEPSPRTASQEQLILNAIIVVGLLVLALVVLALIFMMHRSGQALPEGLVTILGTIVGGMVTFLAHPTNQSNLSAPDAQNLTVNQNPETDQKSLPTNNPDNNSVDNTNSNSNNTENQNAN